MASKFAVMVHICGTDFAGHGETIEEARQDLYDIVYKTAHAYDNADERDMSEDEINLRNCYIANLEMLK